jgi:hypothetical protein
VSADPAAHRAACLLALGVAVQLVGGCGAPPRARTTFLRSVDLVAMTDQMAQSFTGDEIIGARTPADDAWIISLYRIVNHTNQIIPEREKWLYVARLRALLQQSDVGDARRIIWIIPPERWTLVATELGVSEEPYGLRLDPTHLLTATFNALTTTAGSGRSDTYFCSYELVDLGTGRIVWEDSWEVKRSVSGLTYD